MILHRCGPRAQSWYLNFTRCQRRSASSASSPTSKLRNLAVVAHIDSGKTTLTESILYRSDYLKASGTVDTGSTVTDFLPAERARGITIQSASVPVQWKDYHINLIDTPGHADFGMEVESASRVVDGAIVVLDSVEGVEAQTKGVWQQLNRYGVPTRMMFMNKMDRPGSSYHSSMLSLLAHRIHPNPMALTLPIASFDTKDYKLAEPGIQGLVDLVKWEVWRWRADTDRPTRTPLPNSDDLAEQDVLPSDHPLLPHLLPARAALLENLSMFSEPLMEQLLDLPANPSANLAVAAPTVISHLREAVLRSEVLPIFCGAAVSHIGTEILLDYAGDLLASPMDVANHKHNDSDLVQLLAWKVAWDSRKGWMTFVRVYSGTLRRQTTLNNTTRNVKERISKVQLLYANEAVDVEELPYGSVGVILGLKHTRTGDTLSSTAHGKNAHVEISALPNIVPPPAVMTSAIIPQSHADLAPVEEALNSLTRTDPSVRVETHEGQLLVHGLGALHLEIVAGRLKDEWKANFELGRRYVSYREGLGSQRASDVPTSWSTNAGGGIVTASVNFEVNALDENDSGDLAWGGNRVFGPDGKPLAGPESAYAQTDPMGHIARGIAAALSNSPNTSLQLSKISVKISSHTLPPDAPPTVLTGASAFILREQLKAHGPGPIMEPYIQLNILATEDTVGRIVKDLTEHGGEVVDLAGSSTGAEDSDPYPQDGVYIPPAWLSPSTMDPSSGAGTARQRRNIAAVAPLSQMLDHSVRLRALSGGHGQFDMAPAGFRTVSEGRKMDILREIGRA
ncbi:P-loop containing nucleoside triphosphate hydrolase protein [Peniophora sp. CONT]|nr:P-loop containing nucleoside triphosphate hydrolase protein [Peniophora sp. CONT]